MNKKILDETILVIDVGNTNTVFAISNINIYNQMEDFTNSNRTSDEYETHMNLFCQMRLI